MKSWCGAEWEGGRTTNSMIPSIFDHGVRNLSTRESYYQLSKFLFALVVAFNQCGNDHTEFINPRPRSA
jgi:hypothetical protein